MLDINAVDILIVLALVAYVLSHIQEGFLVLSRRILSFFGAAILGFLLYEPLASLLSALLPISQGYIDAFSFISVFLGLHFLLDTLLHKLIGLFPREVHRSEASRFLATIPALIDGLIITSLSLLILVVLPVLPGVKQPIENSHLGSALVHEAASLEVYIDRVFGEATRETLGFLTIKPEEDETIDLPFQAENLSVDESAERMMLELLNEERVAAGVPPLELDPTIVPVARAHSRDMWERAYFAHENPDRESPFDRMREGRVLFSAAGENLALARTVERAHRGLMNSPGHKRNILDPIFTRVGIGVIDGGIYGKMFTQNFAD